MSDTTPTEVPVPAPVLANRQVEVRGVSLPATSSETGLVWVPLHVLTDLDDARDRDGWATTEALSQDDALVAAGFAVRDTGTESLRGTDALHALLHPTLDEMGGHPYDPAVHGPWYFGDPGTEEMAAAAEAQGYRRCVACGTLPVKYSRGRYQDNQLYVEYENALVAKLHGGYAMFFDAAPVEVVFCHDCAHRLCDQMPALGELLGVEGNHSHTDRYRAAHPDHDGWDYRRIRDEAAAQTNAETS